MTEQKCIDPLQENEFTYEGVHYIGVTHADFTCEGCALNKSSMICMNAPYCSDIIRSDKRNLIFVEK